MRQRAGVEERSISGWFIEVMTDANVAVFSRIPERFRLFNTALTSPNKRIEASCVNRRDKKSGAFPFEEKRRPIERQTRLELATLSLGS